jgi:hypothetical protein
VTPAGWALLQRLDFAPDATDDMASVPVAALVECLEQRAIELRGFMSAARLVMTEKGREMLSLSRAATAGHAQCAKCGGAL